MINRSPLPIWNEKENTIVDGTFFDSPDICGKQKNKTCRKHYENIKLKRGFHQCHAGCSSYSTGDANNEIYTGIRVSGYYDQSKLKTTKTFMPTLPPKEVLKSVSRNKERSGAQDKVNIEAIYDKDLVDFCLHETRKYNLTIKRVSEEYLTSQKKNSLDVVKLMKTVFASSTSITNRLNIYDMEGNPQIVTASTPFQASAFGKFQKASHCLEIYGKDAGIRILPFKGKLYTNIDMYPIFDFIPHVILENAIKYSPPQQEVQVVFEEDKNGFEIRIESIGPTVPREELPHLFEKNFRGSMAKVIDTSGGGYGLYFAKLIGDLHGIDMTAISGDPFMQYNGIDYSHFVIGVNYKKNQNI